MSDTAELRHRIRAALNEASGVLDLSKTATLDDMTAAVLAVIGDEWTTRLGEQFVADSRMRALEVRDGRATLDVAAAREVVGIWAGASRTLLKDAENYAEIELEFSVGGTGERYAFTLQRVGKSTPHQLRRAAEAKLAAVRKVLDDEAGSWLVSDATVLTNRLLAILDGQ